MRTIFSEPPGGQGEQAGERAGEGDDETTPLPFSSTFQNMRSK
jgi:hypothetical protein